MNRCDAGVAICIDPKVDEYYARYAREMDPAKRKAIAREFQEFSAEPCGLTL